MHVESGTMIHEIFQQWIFFASPVILLNRVDVLSSPLPQFVFSSFTWRALFLPVFVFQTLALSVKVCIHLRSSQCITDYTMRQHTSDPLPTLYKQSHCSSLGMPRVCFSLQGCVKHWIWICHDQCIYSQCWSQIKYISSIPYIVWFLSNQTILRFHKSHKGHLHLSPVFPHGFF